MACVYVYRNRVNGKCYVGQTVNSGKDRFRQHKYHRSMPVGGAIRKYGPDAFEIIEYTGIPSSMLDFAETEMIARLNSVCPNGYNLHLGGQANRLVSQETGRKIGLANKGKKRSAATIERIRNALLGQTRTPEQRRHISEALKDLPKSAEHRGAVSKARIESGIAAGNRNPSARKVMCVETGEVFGTMTGAAKKHGIKSIGNICGVCRGINKMAGGYHWEYAEIGA